MKHLLGIVLAALIVIIAVPYARSLGSSSSPPGVSVNDWIPFGDAKKIDLRVIDAGKHDSGIKPELKALVVGILHGSDSPLHSSWTTLLRIPGTAPVSK
jgi:hypothetical protein